MPITTDEERAEEREKRRHVLAYRQRLVIFFVVVFAFGVVSIRTEIQQQRLNAQQHAIETSNARQAEARYRECLLRNESTSNLNALIDTIVIAVRTAPDIDAKERERRAALYTAAKGRLFDCGKDPRP